MIVSSVGYSLCWWSLPVEVWGGLWLWGISVYLLYLSVSNQWQEKPTTFGLINVTRQLINCIPAVFCSCSVHYHMCLLMVVLEASGWPVPCICEILLIAHSQMHFKICLWWHKICTVLEGCRRLPEFVHTWSSDQAVSQWLLGQINDRCKHECGALPPLCCIATPLSICTSFRTITALMASRTKGERRLVFCWHHSARNARGDVWW